jgi:hypothetical protein
MKFTSRIIGLIVVGIICAIIATYFYWYYYHSEAAFARQAQEWRKNTKLRGGRKKRRVRKN